MAEPSMLDSGSCSMMHDRVEIDTSLPFQSVKAAVSMFGAKVDDAKKSRAVEKHGAKEAEMSKLKEELSILKRQLADAEEGKAKAFAELGDARKCLEKGCGGPWIAANHRATDGGQQGGQSMDASEQRSPGLEGINGCDTAMNGSEQSTRSMDRSKPSNLNTEEKHVVWEGQLKVAQEQHMNAVAELASAKKELEELREELMVSLREKESAIRQAEEAFMSAELNAKRVEELSHEISGTNESLVLVKLACIEASKESAALLAAKGGGPLSHDQSMTEHDIDAVQQLEARLTVAAKELIRLREELAMAKEAEVKVATAASEAYAHLAHTKSELERTRLQSGSAGAPTSSVSSELKVTKLELEKALENGVLLQSAMDALQLELAAMRKELADLTSREATASAAVATLTLELSKTKADLASAIAAENKANQALLGLTQTLQQIQIEADEAKVSTKGLKEEASRARAEAEHAKDAMESAQREVEAAVKAAEAAKAAESEALKKFKALAESTNAEQVAGGGKGISVSHEEYEEVKEKLSEAEKLADMRVAAANAQVETVKMGELELEQKLKALNEIMDTMKDSTQQALQRAEMAESAKLAVESELRRQRERRFPTKKMELSGQMSEEGLAVAMGSSRSRALYPYSSSVQQAESLAQILKMKMPPLEHDTDLLSDHALGHRKKKHYLPGLSIFSSKKGLVKT